MKPITIDEIDYSLQYEGYVWYSGERQPDVIKGPIDATLFDPAAQGKTDSLFVIEGNLYAAGQQRSVSIRFVDGDYLIHQVDLGNIPDDQLTRQTYLSHRFPEEYPKITMVQYWDEIEDELLPDGMITLVPAWTAFVGFVK